ncbi:MAG: HAMP domain-containing protein [Chloroflexi bacterium CFX4]|nr:HAMP domain-containing protein [Chloroflexi bacterium CFX4]MDL1921737.1 HAMP domain-containing protein [Chloroflexi bacterium CFX3]
MNLLARFLSVPLRWKLLGSLLIIGVLIVMMTLFAGAQYARDVQPIGNILVESLARERSITLQAIVNSITANLRNLVDNPPLQDAYATLAAGGGSASIQPAQALVQSVFQNLLDNNPTYWQVRFVSIGGRALLAVPSAPQVSEVEEDYFRTFQRDLTFSGIFISQITRRAPDFEIDFATIVRRSGRPIGYLVISVDPTGRNTPTQPSILTALRPLNVPAGVLGFYLIAPDGRIDTISEATVEQTPEQRARAAQLAAQTFTTPINYLSPVTNRAVRGFAVPVRGMDRVLVAEAQVLLTARTDETGRFLAEFGAVSLVVIGVLALLAFFLDWTVARPMRLLAEAAQRAAQGRGLPELNIHQNDEIGSLAAALPALGNISRQDVRALESRLSQRTREVEATRAIGQTLFTLRDTESLMRRVVELLCTTFEEITHAHIFALDAGAQMLVMRVAHAQSGESPLRFGYRLNVSPRSVAGRAIQGGQFAVQLFDENTPNEMISTTRAELALPLRMRDGYFGVLDLHSDHAETFGDAEISLFQTLADQIAVAITNAQLFEESQARLAEIEDLNRRMLGEAWRGYEVARRRAMPRRGFTAPEHDSEWSELQLSAYQTGELQERIDEETVTFAVPVALREQRFGAVEWTVPRTTYNENMRLLARELASRLAVNADNARLLEQSQRLAERERLVNTISDRLSRQTNVEQVLQVAVKELGQALRLPQASIRLAADKLLEPVQESGESHARNDE